MKIEQAVTSMMESNEAFKVNIAKGYADPYLFFDQDNHSLCLIDFSKPKGNPMWFSTKLIAEYQIVNNVWIWGWAIPSANEETKAGSLFLQKLGRDFKVPELIDDSFVINSNNPIEEQTREELLNRRFSDGLSAKRHQDPGSGLFFSRFSMQEMNALIWRSSGAKFIFSDNLPAEGKLGFFYVDEVSGHQDFSLSKERMKALILKREGE